MRLGFKLQLLEIRLNILDNAFKVAFWSVKLALSARISADLLSRVFLIKDCLPGPKNISTSMQILIYVPCLDVTALLRNLSRFSGDMVLQIM
jgi:hypothetical protein